MHILLIAPHPFYQERGTPIAVRLLLRALSALGHRMEVVTFHEGEDVVFPGVTLHRIRRPFGIAGVGPGFSLKKLICDVWLFFRVWGVARRERPERIHAVEEAVFMAPWFGVPYIYDMDSCLSAQLIDKAPLLRPLGPLFRAMERSVVRRAEAVVPVCPALADTAVGYGAKQVIVLPDISLLHDAPESDEPLDLPARQGVRFMYIGNLEGYQGVDLLVEALARARATREDLELVVVGGTDAHQRQLRESSVALGIESHVIVAGARPTSMLPRLCAETDVLVSPRTRGVNTPMKIYSYLESGKPLLATSLPTHTQVLTDEIACLAAPTRDGLADGMLRLARDPDLRSRLGAAGRAYAQTRHSYPAFAATVAAIYPA
jgi:glycosyltransferase involved in cell wall biosynthesis